MSAEVLPPSASVIVIGAGPTGLTVAALLARYGIEVLMLERNAKQLDIPRAIVLDDEGARTLQAAGVIDALMPLLVEGDGPIFYEDDGSVLAAINGGTAEYGFRKRYFMHQPELERVLYQGLVQYPNARVCFGAEVVSLENLADCARVGVRHGDRVQHIVARVVLACDGARSAARELLGIKMQGDTYQDDWLVVDTLNDADTSRSSKAHCSLRRPYMSIPAPRGGRRYEFKLLPGETRESMVRPEAVRALIGPIRSLDDPDIVRAAVYSFEARLAERLIDGRTLLLGDAAHLTPPFAGQGMNAGLRDALNVAWKVALVIREQASLGLLQSYEAERRDGVWAMIQLAVAMGEVIMPRSDLERAIRAALLEKLSAFPGGREYLLGMRFKPRPRFTSGTLVDFEHFAVPGSLVGCMVPQPRVAAHGRTWMLDELLGTGFALITQSPDVAEFAVRHREQLWPELAPVLIHLAGPAGGPGITDDPHGVVIHARNLEPAVAAAFKAHRDQLLLVRPDRHAALSFWPHDAAEAVAAFRARLRP